MGTETTPRPQRKDEDVVALHFGPFELDLRSGELRRGGALLKLQPQPFKVLALLADHVGWPAHKLRAGETHDHDDDRHDHQQLDQRESACPVRRAHAHHCHDPISASKPSPPGLRSAPNENTSTSPRMPGLRYW